MEKITQKFVIGNNIVTYYETYISVSIGYVPSEDGGSILSIYVYDLNDFAGITPEELVEKSWKKYHEEYEDLRRQLWEEYDY